MCYSHYFQDTVHKVFNLLDSGGEKKWLSDPKDRSGTLEAIFQLDQPCHLASIDIGKTLHHNFDCVLY